jgi:hypothetical protein
MPLMVQVQTDDELRRAQAELEPQGLLLVSRHQPGRLSVSEDVLTRMLLPIHQASIGPEGPT